MNALMERVVVTKIPRVIILLEISHVNALLDSSEMVSFAMVNI